MSAKRINIRLFVEGVEIPCASASVSASVGAPSSASLQVPYTDELHKLLPRSVVHLFFLDDGVWRLLFAGELVAVAYTKSRNQRVSVLQCADFTTYWDAAKQYYAREDAIFPSETSRIAAFSGSDVTSYLPIIESPGWDILRALRTSPRSMPGVKGLLGGIIHVLERVGGIYKGGEPFSGLNIFFSHAELRLRLSHMMWASDKDATSLRAFNSSHYRKLLKRVVQSSGGMASFRSIINGILSLVYHQYTPVIAPILRLGGDKKSVKYGGTTGGIKKDLPLWFRNILLERIRVIDHRSGLINSAMVGLSTDKELRSTEERLSKISSSDVYDIERADDHARVYINNVNSSIAPAQAKVGAAVGEIDSDIIQRTMVAFDKEQSVARWPGPEAGSYGKKTNKTYTTSKQYHDEILSPIVVGMRTARALYADILGLKKGKAGGTRSWVTQDRLMYTLFHPDLFWAAPPLCNVKFPEETTQLQFNKNYLKEPTRVRLTTKESWGGMDKFLDFNPLGTTRKIYTAPNLLDIHGGKALADTRRGSRVILPHEVYTGIIPEFEAIPFLSIFTKDSEEKEQKVHYLQRMANYVYYHKRMLSRSMTWSGVFSPFIVLGMPMVLLDRVSNDKIVPQFIMQPMSIQHSIASAGTATTLVQGACARTHTERGEAVSKKATSHPGASGSGKVPGFNPDDIPQNMTQAQATEMAASHLKSAARHGYEVTNNAQSIMGGVAEVGSTLSPDRFNVAKTTLEAGLPLIDYNERIYTHLNKTFNAGVGIADLVSKYFAAKTTFMQAKHELGILGPQFNRDYQHAFKTVFAKVDGKSDSDKRHGLADNAATDHNNQSVINAREFVGAANAMFKNILGIKGPTTTYSYERTQDLPLEDILKPPWADTIYEKKNIGKDFYNECLGTLSIIDLQDGLESIEDATNHIVELYKMAKKAGKGSVFKLSNAMTKRNSVTLEEMLGEQGFHRASFGAFGSAASGIDNLLQGVQDGKAAADIITSGDELLKAVEQADPKLDPRPARRKAAREYADSLAQRSDSVG